MPTNYDYTIFKSGYYRANSHHQLFINYGYGGKPTFSFVMMRGNVSFIHNLTDEETISVLKNMLKSLSDEQYMKLSKEVYIARQQ